MQHVTLAVLSITGTTGFPAVINFSLQVVVVSVEMLKEMDEIPIGDREKGTHRSTQYLGFNFFFFFNKPRKFCFKTNVKTMFSDSSIKKY